MPTPPVEPQTNAVTTVWPREGLAPALARALEQLTTLHEGYAGVEAVIAIGAAALPALTAILRHTETSGIFEIRSRAVAALAGLGADGVLIDFIEDAHRVADPTARAGEEASVSIAARALRDSNDPRAFPALLKLAKRQPLPGAIEALAAARREEAIPGLVRGLDEDDTRSAAAEGLIRLGRSSRSALAAVVAKPAETSSALRRQQVAMSALADIGIAPWQKDLVRSLVDDADAVVSLHACRALLRTGDDSALCRARLQALAHALHAPLNDLAVALLAPPAQPPNLPPRPVARTRRTVLHLKRPAEQAGPSAG